MLLHKCDANCPAEYPSLFAQVRDNVADGKVWSFLPLLGSRLARRHLAGRSSALRPRQGAISRVGHWCSSSKKPWAPCFIYFTLSTELLLRIACVLVIVEATFVFTYWSDQANPWNYENSGRKFISCEFGFLLWGWFVRGIPCMTQLTECWCAHKCLNLYVRSLFICMSVRIVSRILFRFVRFRSLTMLVSCIVNVLCYVCCVTCPRCAHIVIVK